MEMVNNTKGREEILKNLSPKICVNMLLEGINKYGLNGL